MSIPRGTSKVNNTATIPVRVEPAFDGGASNRPHSISFTKTARGGWRAEGVKLYFGDGEDDAAMARALDLIRKAEEVEAQAPHPADVPPPVIAP